MAFCYLGKQAADKKTALLDVTSNMGKHCAQAAETSENARAEEANAVPNAFTRQAPSTSWKSGTCSLHYHVMLDTN